MPRKRLSPITSGRSQARRRRPCSRPIPVSVSASVRWSLSTIRPFTFSIAASMIGSLSFTMASHLSPYSCSLRSSIAFSFRSWSAIRCWIRARKSFSLDHPRPDARGQSQRSCSGAGPGGFLHPRRVENKKRTSKPLEKCARRGPHGFRSSFRDWAAEETDHPREVIEAALAHVVPNKVEAAYARSDLFERRSTSVTSEAGRIDLVIITTLVQAPVVLRMWWGGSWRDWGSICTLPSLRATTRPSGSCAA